MNIGSLAAFAVLAHPAASCHAGQSAADSSATAPGPLWQNAAAAATQVPDTYGLVIRTAFSLAVVMLIIWGAVYLMRRASNRGASGMGKSLVRVLERTCIGSKKAIYIVQIGNRTLAVGVTDAQMSPLAELDPDETLAAYPALQGTETSVPFAHFLKGMRARLTGAGGES